MGERQRHDLWGERLAERARERAELEELGYKESEIDKIFWDRARDGYHSRQMHIGEAALHVDVPESPHWPDVALPDDPPELQKGS